jgi:hypothetical protein
MAKANPETVVDDLMELAEGAFDGNSNYVLRPPVVAIRSRES